jgi:hypothetical protein
VISTRLCFSIEIPERLIKIDRELVMVLWELMKVRYAVPAELLGLVIFQLPFSLDDGNIMFYA